MDETTKAKAYDDQWADLLETMKAHNGELEDRARKLSFDFWETRRSQNEGTDISVRGHLGCRIRMKGENRSIYAEWYKTLWVKPKGAAKAKPLGKYIKKGKKDPFGYSEDTLARMAKPVEKEQVLETEKAFRIIREQNYCLAQMRKFAKQMIEAEQKWEQEICGDGE